MPSFGRLFSLFLTFSCTALSVTLNEPINLRRQTETLRGDKQCSQMMCVSAVVKGSTIEYLLTSTGKDSVGWMAMGFGHQMANSPMIVMWPNANGSVTLSQRLTPQYMMPQVDKNPPRIATLFGAHTITSGSNPKFAFTIADNGDTKPSIIYAFSRWPVNSADTNARIVAHSDMGVTELDLTKVLSDDILDNPLPTNGSEEVPVQHEVPLLPYQRVIVIHAVFSTLGFLLLLPFGALFARYLRTFKSTWFTTHWVAQFAIAGPVILSGFTLGIRSVHMAQAQHLNDSHKKWGVAIFILYAFECALGTIIHFVKPNRPTRRPLQNYLHAILGLTIIGLAFGQVYSGYATEWPMTTGRGEVSGWINTLFHVWVVVLPVTYAIGLILLPRQFRQERKVFGLKFR